MMAKIRFIWAKLAFFNEINPHCTYFSFFCPILSFYIIPIQIVSAKFAFMRYRLTLILFLLLPFMGNATVPPGTVQRLSEEDGLSSNHVLCCMQDSRGFLWIGTDTGLDRYDGVQIQSLERPTRCLAESDGIIWAGTEDGL